jgi:hypothetical protein
MCTRGVSRFSRLWGAGYIIWPQWFLLELLEKKLQAAPAPRLRQDIHRPNSSLTWLLDFTVCYVSWSTGLGVGRAAYDVSEALYRDVIM